MKSDRIERLENQPDVRQRTERLRRLAMGEPSEEQVCQTQTAAREALRMHVDPEAAGVSSRKEPPRLRVRRLPVFATVVLAVVGAAAVLTAGYTVARSLGVEWLQAGGDRTVVARVGSETITRSDIEQSVVSERFLAVMMSGPGGSYSYEPLTSGDLLNRMIETNVLYQEAVREGFTISDKQLDEAVVWLSSMMKSKESELEPFMSQFEEYLGGMDTSVDEYLQKARPSLKKSYIIHQLQTKVLDGVTESSERTAVWDQYKADLVERHQSEIHIYETP